MRWTLRNKIAFALLLVVCLGAAAIGATYFGLGSVQRSLEELADVKEPISAAAYEMEINVNGIGLGLLSYLHFPDVYYREFIAKDQSDFEQYHAKYLSLVEEDKAREHGASVGKLYGEFKALAHKLMDLRDRQGKDMATMSANFERINSLIDRQLQPLVSRSEPNSLAKIEAVIDMEADIAEFGLWLTRYQYEPMPEYKRLLLAHDQEFRDTLQRFQDLELTGLEQRLGRSIQMTFAETHELMRKLVGSQDALQKGKEVFKQLHAKIDDLLDSEIQARAVQNLSGPRERAEQTTTRTRSLLQLCLLLFVGCAVAASVYLAHSITRPVTVLVEGTLAVSAGDLGYRIRLTAKDELGELAQRFNEMVGNLEATTVSKHRLEDSEAKLRQTVVDLRREIIERERAEAEQLRLQTSLRRSETMSAIGALTAGVAHEVRNPLFGISSTLDAFSARFGADPQHQRYIDVLRGEVDRLSSLMRALLDYGKPAASEPQRVSLKEVVSQALRASAALAKSKQVTLVGKNFDTEIIVRANPERLRQVFQNLLENAIQHSAPGQKVSARIEMVEQDSRLWASCTVADQGPGFPADDLPHVFEPFFTKRRDGTGLGLSIVQKIVEEHAGSVIAANRPEGGAAMSVRLPLVELAAQMQLAN